MARLGDPVQKAMEVLQGGVFARSVVLGEREGPGWRRGVVDKLVPLPTFGAGSGAGGCCSRRDCTALKKGVNTR